MNTRLSRTATRTAGAALAVLAAVGTFTAMASPSTAVTPDHTIDSDAVTIRTASGQVYGTSWEFLRGGTVQATMPGKVAIYSTATGCVHARAVYTYADGSTSTKNSPRACKGDLTTRDTGLASSTTKNLVKYAIQLLKSTDSTAPATVIAGSTYFVGDAPDSFGTKERLDHDVTNAAREGATVYRGSVDYSITRTDAYTASIWSVRSRVIGDLTWSDKLVGSYAAVSILWTYADGSTSEFHSAHLYRGGAPLHVDRTSDKFKDVVSTSVQVYTDSRGTFGGAAAPLSKFGDYIVS